MWRAGGGGEGRRRGVSFGGAALERGDLTEKHPLFLCVPHVHHHRLATVKMRHHDGDEPLAVDLAAKRVRVMESPSDRRSWIT